MVDEALRDPISVGMLKTDGTRIMAEFHVTPGPRIGYVLHALLEEVLEDPKKNTEKYLDTRTTELLQLSDEELKKLGDSGKRKREEEEEREIKEIMSKHHVC
jgi:hypothetical protein